MNIRRYIHAFERVPGVTEASAHRMAAQLARQFRAAERVPAPPPPVSTGKTIDVEV